MSISSVIEKRGRMQPGHLVAVGSQEQRYKGHHILLEAVAVLIAQGRPLRLTLVGKGRHHEALQELAGNLGVRESVRFVEEITVRADLDALIDSAEIFVMPSITEGLPRVLIEAMARGVACVGTDVGGIPELLDARVLCQPASASALSQQLEKVLDDASFRRDMETRNSTTALDYRESVLREQKTAWSRTVEGLALAAGLS